MEQSLWTRRAVPLPSPRPPRQGGLVVPPVAESELFDDLVPSVWTDSAGTSVRVEPAEGWTE